MIDKIQYAWLVVSAISVIWFINFVGIFLSKEAWEETCDSALLSVLTNSNASGLQAAIHYAYAVTAEEKGTFPLHEKDVNRVLREVFDVRVLPVRWLGPFGRDITKTLAGEWHRFYQSEGLQGTVYINDAGHLVRNLDNHEEGAQAGPVEVRLRDAYALALREPNVTA